MANLTVVVPNSLVPEYVQIAEEFMAGRKIDFSGMTATQKGQRYIAELLKDALIRHRRDFSETSGQQSVQTARDAADTALKTAITTAISDAAGVTG